jgi:uncharacterized protein (TIGR02231 family)
MMLLMATLLLVTAVAPVPSDSSPVVEVVVYPRSARVTRLLMIACGSSVVARFTGQPTAADPQSNRAVPRPAKLEGLRWEAQPRASAFAGASKTLEAELRKVREQARAAEQELARLDESAQAREQYFASTERLVGDQMLRGRPDLGAWSAALETLLQVRLAAERARATAGARLRRLEARRRALEAEQAARGAGGARAEYQVEVSLTCLAEPTAVVALSYLVSGAGWTASYEARTRDGERAVELATHATIRQTSGEDWPPARLLLSTALPRENATPPALKPLVVQVAERQEISRRLVARSETVASPPGAGSGSGTGTGTGVVASPQGLSVQMRLPHPAAVPGDGREVRVLLSRTRQRADLHLRAVPRLSPHVFQVADLVNTAPFPLLPGPIDLYRGGSFVGRDQLGETPVRGKLSVTLGIEPRIRVRRQTVREAQRPRRQELGYRYQLVSHLPGPAPLELQDHLPVSELADVRVVLDRQTTPGHRIDPRDGLIRWPLQLLPGVERRVELAFHIEIPARYQR